MLTGKEGWKADEQTVKKKDTDRDRQQWGEVGSWELCCILPDMAESNLVLTCIRKVILSCSTCAKNLYMILFFTNAINFQATLLKDTFLNQV